VLYADSITGGLIDWLVGVSPDVRVVSKPLRDPQREDGVDLRLFRVVQIAPPRTPSPPRLLGLDFLLTVSLPDAAAEQKTVGELLFATLEREDCEVLADQPVLELCRTLGLAPAPGFVLRARLERARAAPRPPLVRSVVLNSGEMGRLEGSVVGPDDIPLAGVLVTAPGLNRDTRSDARGRFALAGPAGPEPVTLEARRRGARAEARAVPGEPVIIRFPLEG